MPRKQIELPEVFDAAAFALRASIYKIAPGVVVAYHPGVAGKSQPSVDVRPAVDDVRTDTDTGALVPEAWPVIPQVPLAMAKGGGASIAFQMKAGDAVLLLSFDQDPTAFRATGNHAPPLDTSRHAGGHWIALPFDVTDPGALADPGGDLVVTPPPGGTVVVGPGATQFAALANLVDSAVSTIVSAFNGHKHVFLAGTAGTPTLTTAPASAPPAVLAPITPAPGSVACELLKTQ